MGKTYENIDGRLRAFIERQPVFFTATAPLAGDGHVNLSPKGRAGTLVVLDELTLAYLDFGGSTAETLAHLRENGRITLMWCAFDGPPNIVRVHGRGEPVFRDDPRWGELMRHFPDIDPTSHPAWTRKSTIAWLSAAIQLASAVTTTIGTRARLGRRRAGSFCTLPAIRPSPGEGRSSHSSASPSASGGSKVSGALAMP